MSLYQICGNSTTPTPTAEDGASPLGVKHYHLDHLGSVQVITSGTGMIYQQIRYTAYGEVRGHYGPNGAAVSADSCSDDGYCREFTGYVTEPVSGLQYAGARFYDPVVGMFLTHDPVRQFANPYAYGPWNPINGTDPTGTIFGIDDLIVAVVLIAAAASAIDVGVRTGSVSAAFETFAITGVVGLATAGAGAYGLGVLHTAVSSATYATTVAALQVAGVGVGAYGTYQAANSGMYATALVAAALTAFGAYDLLAAQGATDVTSSKQQPGEPSVSELDVRPGDVLATDEGAYAKTIGTLDPTGDFGHTQLALERPDSSLAVLTSDAQGQRVADLGDSALSGRGYVVFRPRTQPDVGGIWGWIKSLPAPGGLRQYLGNWGGNVCSATCNSALVAGGINTGIAPNTFVTPNGLVSNPALVRVGPLPYVP